MKSQRCFQKTLNQVLCMILPLIACLAANTQGQGTITFGNTSSSLLTNSLTGKSVTSDENIEAALFWAPLGSTTFVQIGPATKVGLASLPGVFAGGTRTTGLETPGGGQAQFQVRAWQPHSGLFIGQSAVVLATTGDPAGAPPTPPGSLAASGLQGFALGPAPSSPLLITCASDQTVPCGTDWSFDAPTASSDCDSNPMIGIWNTVTNLGCPQVITRIWLAVDSCTNTAVCSQTITLIDTTPPNLVCAAAKTVECGTGWSFDVPLAADGCDGTNITVAVVSTVTNRTGFCGRTFGVTRTWQASDSCTNTSICSQTITVVDTTSPSLTCASNRTVECDTPWVFGLPSVWDACDGTTVMVAIVSTVTNRTGTCGNHFSATRTWVAIDGCANSSVCSQTIFFTCPLCSVLALTKTCPPDPVPPGGLLVYAGAVTNVGGVLLSNVVVMCDKPFPGTVVFGPMTLAPGHGASFNGGYLVPFGVGGPYVNTLTAQGASPDGVTFTNSITTACPGTGTNPMVGDVNGDGVVDASELNLVLSNYWAQSPWICMTNATRLCDGQFQFALTNASAWNFTVLASSNLVDWTSLPGPAYPVFQFQDPQATNGVGRYYRLRMP